MKKHLILTALVCLSGFLRVNAQETSGTVGTNITWRFQDNTLIFSGSGSINSRPWLHLADQVQKIVIEEGITTISAWGAFTGHRQLKKVVFPKSLISIATATAFAECYALDSIVFPENLTSFGTWTFYLCYSLSSVVIPKGVTVIGFSAFYVCRNLRKVTNFALTPQPVDWDAFAGVDLSKGVLYVPSEAVETYKTAPAWSAFGKILSIKDRPATLSALTVTPQGSTYPVLSPPFHPDTLSYTATVSALTERVTITAIPTNAEATVDGAGNKSLNVGDTPFQLTVTEEDETQKTYTISVHRLSNDAALQSLSISGQNLLPAFNPNTVNYTVTVPNQVTGITVNAAANHSLATVTGTGNQTLTVGDNPFPVKVTAEDSTVKTYTVTVHRVSSDATLKTLTLNNGDIPFGFDPAILNHTVTVPYSVSGITIAATANHLLATVTGHTGLQFLNIRDNPFKIIVTAEDGTEKTYILNIYRLPQEPAIPQESAILRKSATLPESPDTLRIKAIIYSDGTVSITQNMGVFSVTYETYNPSFIAFYMDTVPNNVHFMVSEVVNYTTATIYFDDSVALSETVYHRFPLTLLYPDRSFKQYDIHITRLSRNPYLQSVNISPGALVPTFAPNIFDYSATVGYSTDSITLSYYKAHVVTTVNVTVNGSWSPYYSPKSLAVGENTILIRTVSEDELATALYTLAVRRRSNDATLKSLTLNGGDIPLEFDPATSGYTVTVPYSVLSIMADAETNHDFAEITAGTGEHPLSVGNNTLSVAVTAEDADFTGTYTVTVRRRSNDATLKSLLLNSGDIPLEFDPASFSYPVTVPNSVSGITVHAETNHESAEISAGAGEHPLSVGNNTLSVAVTAEDADFTETYTLAIYRLSSDATLKSLTLNNGDIPFGFDPAILNYTVSVPYSVLSIMADAETNHDFAEITAGTGEHPLSVGDNTLSVAVTAEDADFTGTYSVTVRRRSNDATLKSLLLNSGDIPLEFDPATFSYPVITVPYSIDSIKIDAETSYDSAKITAGTGEHPLSVGDNTLSVAVTAEDADFTETYTLAVRRRSNDATLKSLALNDGDILLEFDPAVFSYTVWGPSSVPGITVDAETNHEFAKITAGTGYHLLTYGNNIFEIKVTSEDGTVETYTVTVIHTSNDATLKSLTLNNGVIPLPFRPGIFKYKVEVEDEVSDIVIACEANHPEATVSGADACHLNYGDNVFPVTVTAEDRITDKDTTTLVYTITVHRINNDATLKYLVTAPVELVPPFDPDITQYTASVPYPFSSVRMDFEVNYPLAELWTADELEQPGIKPLNVGENVFGIGVFSETKKYYRAYWVRITREAAPTGFHEAGKPAAVHVYTANGWLHVNTPAAERINIYSVTGTLLYSFDKPAGAFTLHLSPVLIVKGSSGWTGKLGSNLSLQINL
ncbi:MAG: cadherin-like beta sandwich domain-containing protein [Dysgonamonadaceae bacterium]|jgi:hypothetical protein|nr:cadherin-like beta sandwich domain-containing protein [Dysgonamonadaceae bacterium]